MGIAITPNMKSAAMWIAGGVASGVGVAMLTNATEKINSKSSGTTKALDIAAGVVLGGTGIGMLVRRDTFFGAAHLAEGKALTAVPKSIGMVAAALGVGYLAYRGMEN